jgi:hypothetical protein
MMGLWWLVVRLLWRREKGGRSLAWVLAARRRAKRRMMRVGVK